MSVICPYPIATYPISITVATMWIGITKNQPSVTTFGSGVNTVTNAEKYLEYDDGTMYKAIGGVRYGVNENSVCMRSSKEDGLNWSDKQCIDQYKVLCEYNCDNINNS